MKILAKSAWTVNVRRQFDRLAAVFLCSALALAVGAPEAFAQARATVSIQGERFFINGTVTHPGTRAEGLLLNTRMVQAIFDDENPQTVGRSAYPDTGRWDPERNVQEFIAALPSYAAKGVRAVTVGLQGGSPQWTGGDNQSLIVTAFNSDGTLKSAWLSRLDRVVRAADQRGITVIVNYFYFGQDHRLANEAAVINATDRATAFLVTGGYRNVLVEVSNECNQFYQHAILQCGRVAELHARIRQRSNGTLKVSSSLTGGQIPSSALMGASDYVLLHGNSQSASKIAAMVDQVRASSTWQANKKPIVFNEDSTNLANMDAAVSKRASWGYHDGGTNNYRDGFQAPPVNWTINTAAKQAFFDRVAALTATSSPSPDDLRVTSFTIINADTEQPLSGYEVLTGGALTLNLAQLPTGNLNLRANTSPSVVGSVRFSVNATTNYRIENGSPYTLGGDSNGDYAPWALGVGTSTITATPFSGADATGTAGTALTLALTISNSPSTPTDSSPPTVSLTFASSTGQGEVRATDASPISRVEVRLDGGKIAAGTTVPLPFTVQLSGLAAGQHTLQALVTDLPGNVGTASTTFTIESTPPPSPDLRVTSFTLINADTDLPIDGFDLLTGGTVTLHRSQLPTANLNLRANTSPSVVGSVRFGLNGDATYSVEDGAPYALAGNEGGDYYAWAPQAGSHTVTATPYSGSSASGTAGAPLRVTIVIVEESPPSPPTNIRIIR